jgi:hypothetical protein
MEVDVKRMKMLIITGQKEIGLIHMAMIEVKVALFLH